MGTLRRSEVEALGFAALGERVAISDRASIYGAERIRIGSDVRIDDFCVLSAGDGGIFVGSYVHIAVGSTLIGNGRITLSDFSNLSSRVAVYSSSDDFSGATLTNPTVPNAYKGVIHADVFLGRHSILGCGSVVLPGVIIEDGVAVGALSLIKERCAAFGIYAGQPARRIKERSRGLLCFEEALQREMVMKATPQ